MADRELLELAAKAAGKYGLRYVDNEPIQGSYRTGLWCDFEDQCWNPLTDNGDAFRLAVKLKMDIRPSEEIQAINIWSYFLDRWIGEFYDGDNDPYAATRRAIVRAAAEIGRATP